MTKRNTKDTYREFDDNRSVAYNRTVAMMEHRRAKRFMIIRRAILAAIILIICVLGIGPIGRLFSHNSGVVKADENLGTLRYKIIDIQDGDTLWSIAEENMTIGFDSIYDYIDDVKECNQLTGDHITSGGCLLVPYYDGVAEIK